MLLIEIWFNPNPLGCVQNRIQIGGFGTVRVCVVSAAVEGSI